MWLSISILSTITVALSGGLAILKRFDEVCLAAFTLFTVACILNWIQFLEHREIKEKESH